MALGEGMMVAAAVAVSVLVACAVWVCSIAKATLLSISAVTATRVIAISSTIRATSSVARAFSSADGPQEDRNTEASTATRDACFMAMWKIAVSDCN